MKYPKLRQSAKGQECTFRTGFCNYDPETTVLAHMQFDGGKMGGKEHDISAAYACSACHEAIDQHKVKREWRWFYMGRALARTHKVMLSNRVIRIGDR